MNDYIVCAGTCTGLVYIWKFGHADLVDARKATIHTDTHTTTTITTNNTSTNSNINNNKQIKYNTYLLTKNYLCHMLQISENPIVTISLVTCPILLQYFTNVTPATNIHTANTHTNNNTTATASNIVYNVSAESYQILNDKTTLFNNTTTNTYNTTTNINTINEYSSTSTSSTSSPPLPPVMLATCDSHGMVQIFAEQRRGDADTTTDNSTDTNNAYITSSDRVLLPCLQANYHSPVISCTFKPPPISLISTVPPCQLGQSQTPYTPTPIHHHTGGKHHQDAYVQSALTAPTTAAYQPHQHQPLPQHQQQQQGGVNIPAVEDPVLSICQYDGGELLLYSCSFLYSFYQKNNTAHLDHLAVDGEVEGEDEEGQNYDPLVDRSSSAIDAFDRLATASGAGGVDRSMAMTSSEMLSQGQGQSTSTPNRRPSHKEPRPKQAQPQQQENHNTGGGDNVDERKDQVINTRQGLGSHKQAIIDSALPASSASTNTPYTYNTQEDTYTNKNINIFTTDTPQPPPSSLPPQQQSSAPMPSFFASNSNTTTVDFGRDNEYNEYEEEEEEEGDMMPNKALNTTPYISTTPINNTAATTLTKPTPTTTVTPLSALKKDGTGGEKGGLNPKNKSARKPKFTAEPLINSKKDDNKSTVVKGDGGGGGGGGKIETALGHPTLHTTQVIFIVYYMLMYAFKCLYYMQSYILIYVYSSCLIDWSGLRATLTKTLTR